MPYYIEDNIEAKEFSAINKERKKNNMSSTETAMVPYGEMRNRNRSHILLELQKMNNRLEDLRNEMELMLGILIEEEKGEEYGN